MATKQEIRKALETLSIQEVGELERHLNGKRTTYDGAYGFTSRNIMVRGSQVNILGMDNPVTLKQLRQALPAQKEQTNEPT